MKKSLAIILAVMMLLAMAPAIATGDGTAVENCGSGDSCTTHEAKIGTTYYTTLKAAIEANNTNPEITLLDNVTVASTLEISGKDIPST